METSRIRSWTVGVAAAAVLCGGLRAPRLEAQGLPFFGEPVNLGSGVNGSYWDVGGGMTDDGLSLFIVSNRPGLGGPDFGSDIFVATRKDRSEPFEKAAPVEGIPDPVNTPWDEVACAVSGDGRELYFSSNPGRGGEGLYDMWVAIRSDPAGPFERVLNLAQANSSSHDAPGGLSCDGMRLYFFSSRPEGPPGGQFGFNIYVAERLNPGDDEPRFGNLRLIGPPVSIESHDDAWPYPWPDEQMLFFGQLSFAPPFRPGGKGQADLWLATRSAPGLPFDRVINLPPPINTPAHEEYPWISCDGKTFLFSSDRPGGFGDDDIYQVRVHETPPCPRPATATRDIHAPRDPAENCGDYLLGDEVPVTLRIDGLRKKEGGCEPPGRLIIRERPPGGWTVKPASISDGGRLAGGAIEWTLQGGALAEGKVLSYTAIAADRPDLSAVWDGHILDDLPDPEPWSIEGEFRAIQVGAFDACGGIRCWNILGAFSQCGGAQPGHEAIRADHLTDGIFPESDFIWFPGAAIQTDFGGAAAADGLFLDPRGRNPGEVPTVFPWNDADSRIDLDRQVFGGSPNGVMAYAQCYLVNTTGSGIPVRFEVSSDDSVQVLLDEEEVWINDVARGGSSACNPQDPGFQEYTLRPGESRLVVKVFDGSGEWNFSIRLVDAFTGQPLTEGIEVRRFPAGPACFRPPLLARRRIESEETMSIEGVEKKMWREGKSFDVRIDISDLRQTSGGCAAPREVIVEERVPEGFRISCPPSHGGVCIQQTITWRLRSEAGLPAALSYRVTPERSCGNVPFNGFVSEIGGAAPFPVQGDRELYNPCGFTDQGFIHSWLLLGPYRRGGGAAPGVDEIRKDYLTDAVGSHEDTVAPRAGEAVETDFGGAAASTGLADPAGPVPINPGGVPVWAEWRNRDGTIRFEDYYGGDIDSVLMYAVTYFVLEEKMELRIGLSSDDAVQVLLDGKEIHINSVARASGACDAVKDLVDHPDLKPLAAGHHQLMVKVFEGAGNHNFRLRFQDRLTGQPVTEGIRICLSPEPDECRERTEPEAVFIRGNANADPDYDISDAVAILGHLFLGDPARLPCPKSADADDNGALEITDAIVVLGHQFLGERPPPAPHPACGPDPTPDALTCDLFPPCRR